MGFLDKLKAGLGKTKNALMGQIDNVLKAFVKIDEDALEELEEALICADVGVAATEEIIEMLRERIKDDRLKSREDTEIAIREIISDMIGEGEPLNLSTTPSVILVIGVNGAGKTTSIGKISNRLRQEGKKVVVAAADTFRAAAIDQLAVWCERAKVELIRQNEGSDPAAVVFDAANAGDKLAQDVLEQVYAYMGEFIANICCVVNPEVVVLGGGVSRAGEPLLEGVKKSFKKWGYHACQDTQFRLATLGNDAGAYGAFKLVAE